MFFLLACTASGRCDFKKSSGPNSFVAAISKPSRTLAKLLPASLGFNNLTTTPPENWSSLEESKGYLGSLLGFCICFVVVFIVLFIWFTAWQIAACCCCARRSLKPSVPLIVFHIIGSAFLILSSIFFFVAAGEMTSGANAIGEAPAELIISFNHIADTINTTVYGAVDNIFPLISGVGGVLANLASFFASDADTKVSLAKSVKTDVDEYHNSVKTDCITHLDSGTQTKVNAYFDETTQQIKDVADKLVTGVGEIKKAAQKAEETITVNLKNSRDEVEYIHSQLGRMLEPVTEIKVNIVTVVQQVSDFWDKGRKWVAPVGIIASLVIFFIAVIYCVLFFFPCCLTRCLYAWFSCFGLLLNVLIILPAAVLAVVFLFLNDNCGSIEHTALGLLGNVIDGITTDQFVEMLMCPEEKPIYDMGFVDVFDYEKELLDPLLNTLTEKMTGALDIKNLNFDIFKNFSESLSWSTYVTSENLVGYNKVEYAPSDNPEEFKSCVKGKDSEVDVMRNDMIGVASFGDALYPELEEASVTTQGMITTLMNQTRSVINNGVDQVTCMTLRCVYSPVKNALCVYLEDGMAWWIMSSLCMIVGLVIMTFVTCLRRRDLLTPAVESDDSEDDEPDLSRFATGKL